ncbi:MAG: phosphoribosylanthranilate isomerase, partial [Synechococcus sp.]|nr:phosphoribosylanthranilate isomerase [Synechococcus sp.]
MHPDTQIWKALRLRDAGQLDHARAYSEAVDALLLDAWSPDQLGGTGHRLPLDWLSNAELTLPWWLAGGISAEWIPELLDQVSPNGIDASSRLEVRPGWKDLEKVKSLIDAIRC